MSHLRLTCFPAGGDNTQHSSYNTAARANSPALVGTNWGARTTRGADDASGSGDTTSGTRLAFQGNLPFTDNQGFILDHWLGIYLYFVTIILTIPSREDSFLKPCDSAGVRWRAPTRGEYRKISDGRSAPRHGHQEHHRASHQHRTRPANHAARHPRLRVHVSTAGLGATAGETAANARLVLGSTGLS